MRLLGIFLIWLGDGHTTLLSKAVVVAGVVITVGGMVVLRWLLFKVLRERGQRASARGSATE